jgi:hypothetical protein
LFIHQRTKPVKIPSAREKRLVKVYPFGKQCIIIIIIIIMLTTSPNTIMITMLTTILNPTIMFFFFDFENNGNNNSTANENINGPSYLDSNYNSNRINVIIIEDTNKCYTTELDKYK